ncbi:MAG: head-tail adaptor protein [Gemmatimonadales bacterium]|nr:head-tail adaptor protein [Gemmatimonadales bacterium]
MPIDTFMTGVCTVRKKTETTSATGDVQSAYADRISALRCRMTPNSVREIEVAGKISTLRLFTLYCDASDDALTIEQGDRVEFGNSVFEVDGIHNPGSLNRHLEISLWEVD